MTSNFIARLQIIKKEHDRENCISEPNIGSCSSEDLRRLYLESIMLDSKTSTKSSSEVNRTFIQNYDMLPSDIQYVILLKLAKDRVSFVAWSFARRSNLKDFKDPSFWTALMRSEGRHVPPQHAQKPGKLMNDYYRRIYNDKIMTGGDLHVGLVRIPCSQKRDQRHLCPNLHMPKVLLASLHEGDFGRA